MDISFKEKAPNLNFFELRTEVQRLTASSSGKEGQREIFIDNLALLAGSLVDIYDVEMESCEWDIEAHPNPREMVALLYKAHYIYSALHTLLPADDEDRVQARIEIEQLDRIIKMIEEDCHRYSPLSQEHTEDTNLDELGQPGQILH